MLLHRHHCLQREWTHVTFWLPITAFTYFLPWKASPKRRNVRIQNKNENHGTIEHHSNFCHSFQKLFGRKLHLWVYASILVTPKSGKSKSTDFISFSVSITLQIDGKCILYKSPLTWTHKMWYVLAKKQPRISQWINVEVSNYFPCLFLNANRTNVEMIVVQEVKAYWMITGNGSCSCNVNRQMTS